MRGARSHPLPLLFVALLTTTLARADTTLLYDTDSPPLKFAASRLEPSIQPPAPLKHLSINQPPPARPDVAVVTEDAMLKSIGSPAGVKLDASLGPDGFQ